MTRRRTFLGLAASGLLAHGAPPADAHGPCDCLTPSMVPNGGTVTVGSQHGGLVYRAVLNPRPAQFGVAPGYLASAYRPDAPTSELLGRSRQSPVREPQLRIPATTPPGVYLVVLWDGEEGGAHNTWDYLHVVNPSDTTTRQGTPDPPRPSARSAAPVVGAAALGVLAGAVAVTIGFLRRRRTGAEVSERRGKHGS